jgi:hypothetical protein
VDGPQPTKAEIESIDDQSGPVLELLEVRLERFLKLLNVADRRSRGGTIRRTLA